MSITVTSTTDSKEAIANATGDLKNNVSENKAASTAPAEDETKEASDTSAVTDDEDLNAMDGDESTDEESESKDEDKKPKKNGYKKRIDKLTSKLSAKDQEIEFWKSEATKPKSPEKSAKEESVKKEVVSEGKPKADNFDTHEEFVEALTDWKLDQKDKEKEVKLKVEQVKTDQQKQISEHIERLKVFQASHEDFDDLMDDVIDVPMSLAVQEVILTSENGPELMYELAKNKAEYKRICGLSAIAAARELGKIEALLDKPESEESKPKITKAPPPIKTLGSKGTGTSTVKPDEMDFQEYKRWRAKHPNG